jgi:hypothetical protein
MTTYTTIPDTDIDQDSPVTQPLMTALRDNPIAIGEGDPTSPGINGLALQNDYNINLPVATVAAGDVTSAQGEGLAIGITGTFSTTDVVGARYTIKSYTGTLRFKCSHRATGGATSTLSLYKNNVLVQSYTNGTTSFVARSNDVSIVPNDVLEWRHKTSNALIESVISSIVASADDPYVEQTAYRLSSEELSI